ncbi:DUF3488 and DUF4129 domain-containing transglutaminase family protein [Mesobacillus maritimus]|uniref:transglutaminase TgpA family protein n=1 Tax=Mesobacillus maritimus TaxID=1643336 RepID=UPI002041E331|nr:transglutaminaseTgpA domain-containing protein [Mesobacillus maritimus]MCM3671917.1 DUF3488 and DUF4129 domain-containing transglutaminase family protein [Mesobacillus maritimus]
MRDKQLHKKDFPTFVLYLLSFFLLWEWLGPIQQLTKTGHVGIFMGFIIMALLLSFLQVNPFFSLSLKVGFILWAIHRIYYEEWLFQLSWVKSFLLDAGKSLVLVWNGDFPGIFNSFRTVLFFLLLWTMIYLIKYWITKKRQILFFVFMTLVFITVLDTFTPYKANLAIIRTVIIGFFMMGILTFKRLTYQERIPIRSLPLKRWVIPLAMMLVVSTSIGILVPKADPIWPDPVPFIKSLNPESGTESTSVKRAGYGEDDSRLGGPFLGDDTVVFRAEVDERHYWKVETKDFYTGKGWVVSEENDEFIDFNGDDVPPFTFNEQVPTEELSSTVYNVFKYSHIQYPHGLKKIDTEQNYWYRMDISTQKISSMLEFESETPDIYTVQFEMPTFQVEQLQNSSPTEEDYGYESLKGFFTQLPEGVPETVYALAEEITAEQETTFDKVQAVEQYFHQNGFVYDQVNVELPEENEDYVAQFLFETKRGYCDNFSTSMAVLLRTLDIPARWVKGYTSGDFVETLDSGKRVYEVTNNHAHSWVEVFFPEIGWVPFEPTRGFSDNIIFEREDTPETMVETEEAREVTAQVEESGQMIEPEEVEANSSGKRKEWFQQIKKVVIVHWKTMLGLIVIVILGSFLINQYRGKWLPFYYILRFKYSRKDDQFALAYLALLAQLDRYGLKRQSGQTLRQYAKEVDRHFIGKEMRVLTDRYEQLIYRGTMSEGTWEETKVVWETMMRKIVA